ncbi:hypothetical protein [Pseudomonas mandelii]|jgi:short subunit dehydrogenase-like uncharacterized protein|nr:hypothetical protein [Pseudomonas mandelii]
MSKLLIYGATGYTGRMVAAQAKAAGLNFEVAGRDATSVAALARQLSVPYRTFTADAQTAQALSGVTLFGVEFAESIAGTVIVDL